LAIELARSTADRRLQVTSREPTNSRVRIVLHVSLFAAVSVVSVNKIHELSTSSGARRKHSDDPDYRSYVTVSWRGYIGDTSA